MLLSSTLTSSQKREKYDKQTNRMNNKKKKCAVNYKLK